MIEPVMSRPAGTLVAEIQHTMDGVNNGPGVVSEQDKALFAEKLNAPVESEQLRADASVPAQQEPTWVLPAPPTPAGVLSVGERVLQGMSTFKEGWAGAVDAMQMLASRDELKPSEMINIQFQLGYSSMMLSTVSQEVGSISQKIDGLLKTG